MTDKSPKDTSAPSAQEQLAAASANASQMLKDAAIKKAEEKAKRDKRKKNAPKKVAPPPKPKPSGIDQWLVAWAEENKLPGGREVFLERASAALDCFSETHCWPRNMEPDVKLGLRAALVGAKRAKDAHSLGS